MTKPFDPWVLRAKVSVFLELHRKNEQLARLLARRPPRGTEFLIRLDALERELDRQDPPDTATLRDRVRELRELATGPHGT